MSKGKWFSLLLLLLLRPVFGKGFLEEGGAGRYWGHWSCLGVGGCINYGVMQMEESPRQPDAMEQLSQVAGGLAHEIRNPLSTLKVNLQLLEEDVRELGKEEDDRVRRSVLRIKRMQDEVNRLRDILDDFIQFVTHHQLVLKPLDINQQIEQLVEFYEPQATANHVRVLRQYYPEPVVCRIDAGLLKQAVLNLFINSQQAMPEGGDLMIRTAMNGDRARIEITDTGTGISPEHIPQIFNAYFSAKKGGTGLGLAMTKRIVEEHGGEISVHSEPGKGTCFTIFLPPAEEKTETKAI
jgi:two-component system, NtrC family, sensor histidine kinase HydH